MRLQLIVLSQIVSFALTFQLPAAEFIPLGDLPGGDFASGVRGLSSNGSRVVGRSLTANGPETYVWSQSTGMMMIPDLPPSQVPNSPFHSFVPDSGNISDDGNTVLTSGPDEGEGVYVWNSTEGTRQLSAEFLRFPRFVLSADGSTVVGGSAVDDSVLGSDGAIRRWGVDGAELSPEIIINEPGNIFVNAISANGVSVGGRIQDSGRAFVWTDFDGLVELPFVDGSHNTAQVTNFSSDGTRAVGTSGRFREPSISQDQLFVWTQDRGIESLTNGSDFGEFSDYLSRGLAVNQATPSLSHVVGAAFVKSAVFDSNTAIPFLWSADAGFQFVPTPDGIPGPKEIAELLDVSDDGSRAIGMANGRLFLVDERLGTQWLDKVLAEEFALADAVSGWQLELGLLSSDGNILAGQGRNPSGQLEAWVAILGPLIGDFDENGSFDAHDIDLLSLQVRLGSNDPVFDLNADDIVDDQDRVAWVEDIAGTFFGDANLDQRVEFADFVLLADHFGEEGGWGFGDFDGSGDVQFEDFLMLSNNFGQSAVTAASVPEPSGPLLLLGPLVIAAVRHRIRVKTGTTAETGVFTSDKIRNLPTGSYTAEVLDTAHGA